MKVWRGDYNGNHNDNDNGNHNDDGGDGHTTHAQEKN